MPHALAYSFVGIQTLVLATNYPSVYWNCACLITNSGGNEDAEEEEEIFDDETIDEDDIEEEEETKTKKKNKTTNYGKIAVAIGQMQSAGIVITPPDINRSSFSFIPNAEENKIIYGMKGITRAGGDLIRQIMSSRPYVSMEDFLSRVKVNKLQMINLIKSGAFDNFGETREKVMESYVLSISDQKKRITLQNMQMLITKGLLPDSLSFEIKVFNFNKYLKKHKIGTCYEIDDIAIKFYEPNFDYDLMYYLDGKRVIDQVDWDKIYKKKMDAVRDYLKPNADEILQKLNQSLIFESWEKYCKGTVSKWEMDSISFYCHEHELAAVDESEYDITDFFALSESPKISHTIFVKGKSIPIYELSRIAGTILQKDKNKGIVTLLTTYGVVNVKIYKNQFAMYDRQLSEKDEATGKKKITEKSWFSRGNKLIVTGIRRGDDFVPKKYKNSEYPLIGLITNVDDYGNLEFKVERASV